MTPKKSDPFAAKASLANEVTIKAGIEGSGVSLKAKSRAISAFDRLVGAAFDIPGIWFERRAERARIFAVTEQEALKIEARAFLENKQITLGDSPSSIPAWLNELTRSTINKAEVASYALEYIKESPPQDEASEEENDDPSQMEDWLNAFVHRAEMASSEAMRSILGRILSGEILSPGSFSVSTLRIITELDRKSASLFQSLCLSRLQNRHIVKRAEDGRGERMYELYDLEERGLIKEVGGSTSFTLEKHSDGYFYFPEGDFVLRLIIDTSGEYIPVSNIFQVMILTNTGNQLAELLPYDQEAALTSVADLFFSRDKVKEIDLFHTSADQLIHMRKIK